MQTITTKHNKSVPNHAKVPQSIFLMLIATLLAACMAAPIPTEIAKTITIQYNPTGSKLESIDAAKVFFATKGSIEAQLPVKIEVLDPSLNVDKSKACEVRFADGMTLMTSALDAAWSNKGLASHNGEDIYPCTVLLRDSMSDLEEIKLILTHELGHIILNQGEHSRDPHSIMSNDVQLPGRYRFTDADARKLAAD